MNTKNGHNGNGKSKLAAVISNDAGNAQKKLGGVTGKGFQPGQSGNKKGGSRLTKARNAIGEEIRKFLDKQDPKDKNHRKRLAVAIERLYTEDLKTLFAYGFGKPAEMLEVAASEGQACEFVVRVAGNEMP